MRGRKIVTSWQAYPRAIVGRVDPPLMRWFTDNVTSGETWLDIGAFHGYTALALAELVSPAGRVFAFEMLPRTAGYLARTKVANGADQIAVVPLGLGDADNLTRVDIEPTRSGMANYWGAMPRAAECGFVVALDRIWPHINEDSDRVHGVKIDVQGWEVEVLRGMTGVLSRNTPKLVVEVHPGVDRQELLSVIAAAGYATEPRPIDPLPGERAGMAHLADDRSYEFRPA